MPNVTIQNIRASYVHVFQPSQRPGQDPKYSITCLLPKADTAGKAALDKAIEEATLAGVTSKWNGKRPALINSPVYDGNGVRPNGEPFGDECKDCWVFTASCSENKPPFIVDAGVHPLSDPSAIYSGCYANVSIGIYPYNFNGKKGIGFGLNGVQKVRDGEPLGGGVTADQAFTALVNPLTGEPIA